MKVPPRSRRCCPRSPRWPAPDGAPAGIEAGLAPPRPRARPRSPTSSTTVLISSVSSPVGDDRPGAGGPRPPAARLLAHVQTGRLESTQPSHLGHVGVAGAARRPAATASNGSASAAPKRAAGAEVLARALLEQGGPLGRAAEQLHHLHGGETSAKRRLERRSVRASAAQAVDRSPRSRARRASSATSSASASTAVTEWPGRAEVERHPPGAAPEIEHRAARLGAASSRQSGRSAA